MDLKEYIEGVMDSVGENVTVQFDVAVSMIKTGKKRGTMVVDNYSSNKVKFSLTKRVR